MTSSLGKPIVRPPGLIASEAADATVEILLSDSRVVPGSVVLQRLDARGNVMAILGTLRDDGTDGDAIAGDNIFALHSSLMEPAPGEVRLRIAAALNGGLGSVFSDVAVVRVAPFTDPEEVLNKLVTDLRVEDIESALGKISLTTTKQARFRTLTRESLARLADGVERRTLQKTTATLREYVGVWTDDNGAARELWITLARNPGDTWKIVSW
jgi:hypothetical protein